jgi:hypothetical protein
VFVRGRKPRPVNLDVFTKQLLHRDLSVYEERKAQASKYSLTPVRARGRGEGTSPRGVGVQGRKGLPALVVVRQDLATG